MGNTSQPEQMIDRLLFGSAEVVDISSTDHHFAKPVASLFVGGTGAVVVDMGSDGESINLSTVNAGTILPLFIHKIKKAGTTATDMVGLR